MSTAPVTRAATLGLIFILMGQFGSAAVSPDTLGTDRATGATLDFPRPESPLLQLELGRARSLGEPESIYSSLTALNPALENLVTLDDTLPEGEDLGTWTDDQIEKFYEQDWNLTEYWLDRIAADPSQIAFLGNYSVAISNKRIDKGPQMSGLTCLAIAIQGEAGGENYEGKVFVGRTIMARAKGRPGAICSVIFAKAQFESMQKRVRKVNAESLRAANAVIKSSAGKKCDYDHFINKKLQLKLGRKIPKWVKNFEKWGCATKKVGLHTFYSSCNCKRGR